MYGDAAGCSAIHSSIMDTTSKARCPACRLHKHHFGTMVNYTVLLQEILCLPSFTPTCTDGMDNMHDYQRYLACAQFAAMKQADCDHGCITRRVVTRASS